MQAATTAAAIDAAHALDRIGMSQR
jgi:hypothetical protein